MGRYGSGIGRYGLPNGLGIGEDVISPLFIVVILNTILKITAIIIISNPIITIHFKFEWTNDITYHELIPDY